jgi:hypothetical protein
VVLTVPGWLLAAGCGDDDPAGEEQSTTVSTSTTSAPVEPTDGDRTDTEPVDEPPAPDPSTLTEAVAPAGLGLPRLPTDADSVVAVFEALPVEMLGATRQVVALDPGTIAARYDAGDRQCGEVGLQGIDLATDAGNAYPDDWRAEDVVALFATGADWDVEDAGRQAARYWVTFETSCGGEDMARDEIISSGVWGDENSTWVFFLGARNTTERQELLAAFVDAALATLGPEA